MRCLPDMSNLPFGKEELSSLALNPQLGCNWTLSLREANPSPSLCAEHSSLAFDWQRRPVYCALVSRCGSSSSPASYNPKLWIDPLMKEAAYLSV